MGNAYSLDVPDVFYHPANPIGAFLQSKNESDARMEEQRRYQEEQRQKAEQQAYQRQRQQAADKQDDEQRRQAAIGQLAMLVDNGRVPEAQALAAAHGLPFQPGGVGLAPMAEGQRAPQLQMPGSDPAPNGPPASFRLPGMQLRDPGQPEAPPEPQQPLRIPGVNARMQAGAGTPGQPYGADQAPFSLTAGADKMAEPAAPPDLGGYARAFLGRKPPPPAQPDGLADYPTELPTTTRKPTLTVGDQAIEMDPNGAAGRADQASERTIRQQESVRSASEELIRQRQEEADRRRFAQQNALQDDRQAGAIALKKTPRAGAIGGGATGPDGQPSRQERQLLEREINNWRAGTDFKSLTGAGKALRAASANLEAEGPKAIVQHKDAAIQMARVFRGNTPTEGEMHYVYGGLGNTFGNKLPQLIEKWSTGDMSALELSNIRESVKTAEREYRQNAAMAMKAARTNLGTDKSEYKRQKVAGLFQSIGVPDDEIDAALGGKGSPTGDPNTKVVGGKTYHKINGAWHVED